MTNTSKLVLLVGLVSGTTVQAYDIAGRWEFTATDGAVAPVGQPVTVRWSIAPDGTLIREEGGEPSNLIAALDGLYGDDSAAPNVSAHAWFPIVESAFDRWSELGGATFVYEPFDDGAEHGEVVEGDGVHFAGEIGVRGDVRIAGAGIDGNLGTVAYNYFPDVADMVIDTNDAFFYALDNDSLRLFNTVVHEAGHALGLNHIHSSGSDFALEPNIQQVVEGPQFDDILGLHHQYGDIFEKANAGAGNNTPAHATFLPTLAAGDALALGTSAAMDGPVTLDQSDFVSIANSADVDYFRLAVSSPALVSITITPAGPSYQIGAASTPQAPFDAAMISDLTLSLTDSSGQTTLAVANSAGLGESESLADFRLTAMGDYLIQVTGSEDSAQMYQLSIVTTPFAAGDYDLDGVVSLADYTLWRDSLGESGFNLPADGNGDLVVDSSDYQLWHTAYSGLGGALHPAAAIPEPNSLMLLLAAAVLRSGLGWQRPR